MSAGASQGASGSNPPTSTPLRVLVVDDSVLHRQTIAELLKGADDIEIVGRAANGEEALRFAALLHPDLITLDLEMPRMDGFTFLRFLMARQPTPVIVISSQSHRENVFKALELGALDFVARPSGGPAEFSAVREELLRKVAVVRSLRPLNPPAVLTRPSTGSHPAVNARVATPAPVATRAPLTRSIARNPPRRLVVIASSTGGPQAVVDLVTRLPTNSQLGVVIAQHMPERFTRTFAERLARRSTLRVAEAEDGSIVDAGSVWVCPGARATEVELDGSHVPRLRVGNVDATDRYVPSADRLFRTAATAYGARVTAVVLTGMGDDGALSLPVVKRAGGEIWVESAESAVVDGMPGAARRTGLADAVLPLQQLVTRLVAL